MSSPGGQRAPGASAARLRSRIARLLARDHGDRGQARARPILVRGPAGHNGVGPGSRPGHCGRFEATSQLGLQWPAERSPVAQLAEHSAVNRRVVGSSPTRGASLSKWWSQNEGRPVARAPFSVPDFVPAESLLAPTRTVKGRMNGPSLVNITSVSSSHTTAPRRRTRQPGDRHQPPSEGSHQAAWLTSANLPLDATKVERADAVPRDKLGTPRRGGALTGDARAPLDPSDLAGNGAPLRQAGAVGARTLCVRDSGACGGVSRAANRRCR